MFSLVKMVDFNKMKNGLQLKFLCYNESDLRDICISYTIDKGIWLLVDGVESLSWIGILKSNTRYPPV